MFLTLAAGRQGANWSSETEAPSEKNGFGHRGMREWNEYEGVKWGAGEEAGGGGGGGVGGRGRKKWVRLRDEQMGRTRIGEFGSECRQAGRQTCRHAGTSLLAPPLTPSRRGGVIG